MRLAQKVAIITGAGSGIGRASALRFAREGARVVALDLEEAACRETVAAIARSGGAAIAISGDVSRAEVVEHCVREAVDAFGPPGVLFNNAGVATFGTVAETSADELERVLHINVRSMWLCARAVIPHMRRPGGGVILNMASITAIVGAPGMGAYATSKGAVITLTRTLALEEAEHGIRVNCLCPASIDTPMLEASFARVEDAAAARARNVKRHPLGRLGTAEDVANLALFLASDEASFITGATYVIDGGALLARRWQD
jgi:2-keto-3-deoxy-L-fuconate dehydrogenase